MIVLQGYRIADKLYESETTLVYRGQRQSDQMPVVIKLLKRAYPSFTELSQFRNQYTITINLNLPGVVRPYRLEPYQNGYALIMEDFGGISLRNYVKAKSLQQSGERSQSNPPAQPSDPSPPTFNLSIREFLPIAIQLTEILEGLYQNQIVHKDIKPTNILIHPETKQVKLIDFSLASQLPKESQPVQNPNCLQGTLAYLSPEQTGRMNRGIDYRTDFYSLGIAFYELLSGQLPFQSDDPMELVHCHIAKQPLPLKNLKTPLKIPPAVSDIVMKLLEKNAENRYQSALGLKFDLEICSIQLQETGKIPTFEIGQRDLCDRFTIPEKLYGRETEIAALLTAFERVAGSAEEAVAAAAAAGTREAPPDAFKRIESNSKLKTKPSKLEVVLVAGYSGIGKTAIVNEVQKPIVQRRGYFIKGKFDQFQRNIPFSAFVDALRDLMQQLLGEGDESLNNWRQKILSVVGENGQVIIEVIPELESIIGPQPAIPSLTGSEAQNRFNLVFQRFIQLFATPAHPLVLFLDDLQWADSASLMLMQLLLSETETGHLLLIGAYRDNEVFPAHPLILTLEEIKKNTIPVNTLNLTPLSQTDINHLVADTLSCSFRRAQPLTDLVYRKTKGNPFFSSQFLKALYKDDFIKFDPKSGYWQCDLAQVKTQTLTDDVVAFVALQLQNLPGDTQKSLQLAACIGNQFDLATLAIVSEQSQTETATSLWPALQAGLILPTSEVYKFYQADVSGKQEINNNDAPNSVFNPTQLTIQYRFLHDRVQQAAYSLIPQDRKQLTHYQLGQLLLAKTPEAEQEERLFEIVNQLNYGIDLIVEKAGRDRVADLNLRAGQKAKDSTAYGAAIIYFTAGMKLLEADCWQHQYDLTFELYKHRAEAEYLNTNFEQSERLALAVLEQAKSLADKAEIYSILIIQYTILAKYQAAISAGKNALEPLGVCWPEGDLTSSLELELAAVNDNLGAQNIASLIELPEMSDPVKKSAIKLLHALLTPAFSSNQQLGSLLVSKIVNLSLQSGQIPESCFGYAFYGTLVSMMLADYQAGYEFGLLALSLSERFNDLAQKTKACNILAAFLIHWKKHIKCCEEFNNIGYRIGLESGQFQFVGYIAYNRLLSLFHAGKNLEDLSTEFQIYLPLLQRIKHYYAADIMMGCQLAIYNLIGLTSDKLLFQTTVIDESDYLKTCQDRGMFPAICIYHILKAQILYLYDQLEDALQSLLIAQKNLDLVLGHFSVAEHNYYHSLILLGLFETATKEQKIEYLHQVQANQEQLKQWADNCPENFQHKHVLVEAEIARINRNPWAAIDLYDRAVALLKENEFVQDGALANELAGKFYLDWGKERIAQAYMTAAYYGYARWGAKTKVRDLEQKYSTLLAPILQASRSPFAGQDDLALSPDLRTTSTVQTTLTSSGVSAELDLATVFKASQALSSEIHWEQLIATLLQVVLENAGADKCVLMLWEDNHLTISAIATVDQQQPSLQSVPIEQSQEIPLRLINTVQHSLKPAVILDATAHPTLAADAYILQQQPRSLLCLPILRQGQLLGVLYLENRLVVAAFSRDRVEVLNLLCAQAAISLENARLYQELQQSEDREREKNKQLERSLQELQQTQLQLVQSEKMSTLGQLVAGVAHEINNPVGFIEGNLTHAEDYVQDLLNLVALYQEHYPQPVVAIEQEIEAIDLDYVKEDLPKILKSMKVGSDRIQNISTSLRTFSRADTANKVAFDVHEGIESTLLILKHRLKASEQRPEIEVEKNYGDLPELKCFPGQLNQVFMNIIANAIDALDEASQGRPFAELEVNPNRITICTNGSMDCDRITISIQDNGPGIPEAARQRIFDRLFTTKAVGKGTGLGLAIAQQIVEEKHNGTLTCTSKTGQGTRFVIELPLS